MPKIDVHTKFTFTHQDAQREEILPGVYDVSDYIANHPYVKCHSTLVTEAVEAVVADDVEQEVESKPATKNKKATE